MYAHVPPLRCASATTCMASVDLPEDSGPQISTTRPRGRPPTPSAISSPSQPEQMVPTSLDRPLFPSFITEPLPTCPPLCASAAHTPPLSSPPHPSPLPRPLAAR